MECLLCETWAKMPYQARYTTPTSARDTEGALIIGYWLHSRCEGVPLVCERHMAILVILDEQDKALKEAEVQQQQQRQQAQVQQTLTRQDQTHFNSVLASRAAKLQKPQHEMASTQPFQFGLEPLGNENTQNNQGALAPQPNNIVAPYLQQNQARLDELVKQNLANQARKAAPVEPIVIDGSSTIPQRHVQQETLNALASSVPPPGSPASAIEAAKAPPVEGMKTTVPCPLCGKTVTTGEVHAC
jgi:hypothetical protein